jgi:hypothetical protein
MHETESPLQLEKQKLRFRREIVKITRCPTYVLAAGKHTLEFEWKYDGPGLAREAPAR